MEAHLLAELNKKERRIIAATEPEALAQLTSEEEVLKLHKQIRRERNKLVGQYRRTASKGVKQHGGRGMSAPKNTKARLKVEALEEALARVSEALAERAAESAAQLREDRLAAARAIKGTKPAADHGVAGSASLPSGPEAAVGDRALKSPVRAKQRGSAGAQGARKQAKRDAR